MKEINIESVSEKFENHLEIESNYRIIFSGKFGTGKTYFLNDFFGKRENDYNKFLISPVNYVVSSNEDIFELIKVDIIKELFLTNKIELAKLPEDTTLQKISNFVEDRPLVLGKFMLKNMAKLSPAIETPVQVINALSKIFKDYKEKSKIKRPEDKTMNEELADYWFDTNEKIGNIYEHNYITKVINTFLKEIKGETKKNILIIDDFDRIDPEHIFRILNILSVHNNQFDSENKFAFDHVIIVCDIDNLRKIFYHKYGMDVDFDGYIDKFYSTDIFEFTNQDALKFYIKETFIEDDNTNPDFLVFILHELIDIGELSVRKLLKYQFDITFKKFILHERLESKSGMIYSREPIVFIEDFKRLYVDSDDLPILRFFKLMSFVYGNINLFYQSLQRLKTIKKAIEYSGYQNVIQFLVLQFHVGIERNDGLFFNKITDSVDRQILRLDYPTTRFLNHQFDIRFQWNGANKYNSLQSNFRNAKASLTD